jgi:hypothetical protein
MLSKPSQEATCGEDSRIDLADRINRKHREIDSYLAKIARQRRWLFNATIIGGTSAATLTAAPALGGKPLADWMTDAFSLSSPAWQILCGLATVCSVTGTLASQFLRSYNIEERIAQAQAVRARLEILNLGITAGHLDQSQAFHEYFQCILDATFVPSAAETIPDQQQASH